MHVSESRAEAEKTLRQMVEYLRFLKIPHTATVDTIELEGELRQRGVKVLACRIGANSGWRATGGTTQESSKWNSEGSNPAEEIVTSWGAQMVTHSKARKRHFSSPMAKEGFFFEQYQQGETDARMTTQGPSWKFNPTITRESCKALAPQRSRPASRIRGDLRRHHEPVPDRRGSGRMLPRSEVPVAQGAPAPELPVHRPIVRGCQLGRLRIFHLSLRDQRR